MASPEKVGVPGCTVGSDGDGGAWLGGGAGDGTGLVVSGARSTYSAPLLTWISTTWPGTARPPRDGLVPTNSPCRRGLRTSTVVLWKPAAASARTQSATVLQRGTGLVFPAATTGSAGGKSLLPRASRIGAIASCQMVAPLPPPKPPTSSSYLGLNTITLAAISGV